MNSLARILRRVQDAAGNLLCSDLPPEPDGKAIAAYLQSDRTPHFARGYSAYKERLILEALADA